jgi:hypothetical protein
LAAIPIVDFFVQPRVLCFCFVFPPDQNLSWLKGTATKALAKYDRMVRHTSILWCSSKLLAHLQGFAGTARVLRRRAAISTRARLCAD